MRKSNINIISCDRVIIERKKEREREKGKASSGT